MLTEHTHVSPSTRASMLANRSKDTGPEIAVRRLLHRLGLRYRVHYRPIPSLRRTADVVFTRKKVALFIDGCFWHGCPEHYRRPSSNTEYWDAKLERNVARDREVDQKLVALGWLVVRVWEHEDPRTVVRRILQTLSSRDGERSS
jgi:DNA mismatch endonuclease (patch repair protein)